jgi:predicted DNA-binding protein YlxM (UPF0122 family)
MSLEVVLHVFSYILHSLAISNLLDIFGDILFNKQERMYECYATCFALINDGGDVAVSAIVDRCQKCRSTP